MKKRTAAAAALLAVCIVGSLSACGSFQDNEADGNYPYDVAVQQGYGESEGNWLGQQTPESTLYRRMWEEAKADGSFSGNYYDFLKSLNLGDDSAYLQQALLSAVSIVAYTTTGSASAGSGVIVEIDRTAGDAEIVTNYHVVYNATSRRICDNIEVYLYGGELSAEKLKATYVYGSAAEDLAVLHIEGDDTVTVEGVAHTNREVVSASAAMAVNVGDSDSLLVGDKVYAVGNPEAWGISVVEGVISTDAEYITMSAIDGNGSVSMLELRTDAPVNHGNSGGGLFNAAGELIGIVNARSEREDVYGIGYAIPIDHVKAVLANIRDNGGKLKLARLNVTVETAGSHSVFEPTSGRTFVSEKLVVRSMDDGSAAAGGMDVGDTIISLTLHGKTVQATRRYKITETLLNVRKGDTLTVVVSREGTAVTLSIPFDRDDYFVMQ